MKKFSYPILLAFILAAFSFPTRSSVKAQCNILSNIVPCSGFVIGQEENSFGQFTGSEEWSALGRAPFPAPSGDFPYGVRLQRNTTTSLYQIERRAGGSQVDVTMAFGATIPPSGIVPPLNRMDFNYVLQNQSVFPPSVRSYDIMTLLPASSKVVSTGSPGLAIACLFGPATSPCFGRVGIERQNPTYTLDVNGIARVTGLIVSSDAKLKDNIATIENPMEVIQNLRGTTYNLKKDAAEDIDGDGGMHSGFIAQEVEKDLPHVVFTDEQGIKAVNYIEVIPYLVEGMKELSDRNAELEREVEALMAQLNGTSPSDKGAGNSLNDNMRGAELFQNVPNPFDAETKISYFLPASIRSAQMLVFDMNGRQLRSIDIAQMGEGTISINGSEFEAGMYFYSLIADGQEVETKRMILTK